MTAVRCHLLSFRRKGKGKSDTNKTKWQIRKIPRWKRSCDVSAEWEKVLFTVWVKWRLYWRAECGAVISQCTVKHGCNRDPHNGTEKRQQDVQSSLENSLIKKKKRTHFFVCSSSYLSHLCFRPARLQWSRLLMERNPIITKVMECVSEKKQP